MATRQLRVELVGDTKSLDRALGRTETKLSRFGRSVGGKKGGALGAALGGGMGGIGKAGLIGAGVAAGSAVAVTALKSVVSAAKEAEVAQANLDQAMKASGTSTAKYGKQIDAAIQKTSKLAGIDDELVSTSYANLLRTTGSVEKATRDVALAANIARARKISLAAAAKVVEKAENGQLRGLKALGVQIDKNTTASEAIERAQKKFAGSAVAYGRTAAGAQDRLSVAFENLRERIGLKLLPTITKLTLKLIDLLDWSEKNWPRFSKAVSDTYNKVKPVIDNMVARIRAVATIVQGVADLIQGIKDGKWSQVWKGMQQIVVGAVKGIVATVVALPVLILKGLSRAAFSGLSKIGTWIKDAIISGITGLAQGIIDKVVGAVDKAGGFLNKVLPGNPVPKIGGGATAKSPANPVPKIGGGTTPKTPARTAPAPSSGPRDRGETRTPTQVNLVVDGRVLAQTMIPQMQRMAGQNAGTTSGRAPVSPYR